MTTVYSDELPLYPVANDELRTYLPQWRSPLQRYFPLNKLRSTKQLAQMVDLMARQIFPDAAKYKIDEYRSSPTSAAPNALVLYRETVDVEGGRRAWNPRMIFTLAVEDISNPYTRSAAHHKAVKTVREVLHLYDWGKQPLRPVFFPVFVISVISGDACVMQAQHPDMVEGDFWPWRPSDQGKEISIDWYRVKLETPEGCAVLHSLANASKWLARRLLPKSQEIFDFPENTFWVPPGRSAYEFLPQYIRKPDVDQADGIVFKGFGEFVPKGYLTHMMELED